MKDWKENKFLKIFLGLLLVVIWGYNIYQVFYTHQDIPDLHLNTPSANTIEALKLDSLGTYYSASFRDPFLPYTFLSRSIAKDSTNITIPNPQQNSVNMQTFDTNYAPNPPFRLTGVVGRIAILEDLGSQEVYLKKVNDEIGMYKVKQISPEYIKLRYGNRDFILRIIE